jgi:hypothetical protein
MEWWSIEVFHGRFSAARWKDAHGAALVEAALTNGAVDWTWHEHRWGVILEVAFLDEWRWEFFYELPAVQAALDAAPDPVKGLLVHRGRGGAAGTRLPRRPALARSSCPSPTRTRSRRKTPSRTGSSRGSMTTCLSRCPTRRRCTNPPPSILVRPCSIPRTRGLLAVVGGTEGI